MSTELKELQEQVKSTLSTMSESIKRTQDAVTNALEDVRKEGTLHAKTADDVKKFGEAATKATEALAKLEKDNGILTDKYGEIIERVKGVEQKLDKRPGGTDPEVKSIGQLVVESDEYKTCLANPRLSSMNPVTVGSFHKTAIFNATGQNQPLVPSQRLPGIIMPGLRRLTIRDLIPQQRTDTNLIEFAKENVFTNNAGPQWDASPGSQEGAVKNESGITFTLSNQAVTTLAHWIPASRQVLSDAKMLQSYIEGRLTYGLKLEEEDELLNGSGSSGELNGLWTNKTAFDGGATNQTRLDTLLKALLQISLSEYEATGFVLNPRDWTEILLLKDTTGRYLFSDPHGMEEPRVWGKPVVATQSMTAGNFLAGAFALSAEIWDREDSSIRVSEHHENFFIKNMVAILCEERLALVIYRAAAIVGGSMTYVG
jgi:HK97 family phage major capsid protein